MCTGVHSLVPVARFFIFFFVYVCCEGVKHTVSSISTWSRGLPRGGGMCAVHIHKCLSLLSASQCLSLSAVSHAMTHGLSLSWSPVSHGLSLSPDSQRLPLS